MSFALALYGSCILVLTLFCVVLSTFESYIKK